MGDIVDFRRLVLVREPGAIEVQDQVDHELDLPEDAASEPSTDGLVVGEAWSAGHLPRLADEQRLELRWLLDEVCVLPGDPVDVGPDSRVAFSDGDWERLAPVYERLGIPHADRPNYPTWRQRHLAAQVVVGECLRALLRHDGIAMERWQQYPPGLVEYLRAVVEGDTAATAARWSGVEGRFVFLHLSARHAARNAERPLASMA